ncbi:efflux RND transporter periplasmic adaptor subunit, partial [Oceanispirochaeta sp.]|uniref:efflux RND transporter periplasmic adaptor subunit n=1 Tax=Oceanispirochaeta sp. TaxID=2035350 RepID=UPI002609F3AE
MSIRSFSKMTLFFTVLTTGLILFGCVPAEEIVKTGSSGSDTVPSAEIKPDLKVPPPGSQASQEKWETFTEEKKQDSWNNYLTSLASEGETSVSDSAAAPESTPTAKSSPGNKTISVVTAPLSRATMEVYYYGLGDVDAGEIKKIVPAAAGIAARVFVTEGDFVEPGDLLFSMDSSEWLRDIELTESKWETELTLVQVRLDEAAKEWERIQTFYDRDLVTRQELDKARQTVTEAQLAMDKVRISRETELEGLQENYRGRLGISPGRGYVSQLSFSEGESVNSSDFVEIVNLEKVLLTIEVPENIITRIERGALVKAKTPSAVQYGIEGVITGHKVVPENNRTYQVRASLLNQNQRLLPGMLMEVQIQ